MSDKKPCPHPFLDRRTAGTTYDDTTGFAKQGYRSNVRTFIWCEACGALGVQKEGALEIEWRLPKERS